MKAKVSVASTDGIDVRDRVPFWEEYNARELVGLRCSTYHDDGLEASQLNVDLGDLRVADIRGNAHVIDRSSRHVADTPKRSVFITHMLAGTAFFLHARGCLRLGPGDTIVYDTSQPYLFGFESVMHQVLLDIPCELLGGGGGDRPLPVVSAGPLHGRGSRSAALVEQMRVLLADSAVEAPRDVAARSRDDLLSAAVALLRPEDASGSAMRSAASLEIHNRLADPDLTAEAVAREVGVSLRHLNRLFAEDGSTVAQQIQQHRLAASRRDLADPSLAGLRIADIAMRWGFSSQAHFTRAFRRAFGCTPSDVRGDPSISTRRGRP